jgi:hypothetical protein
MLVGSLLARLLPLDLSEELFRLPDMGLFLWKLSSSRVIRLELVGLVRSVWAILGRGYSIDVVPGEPSRSLPRAPSIASFSC